MSHPSIPHHEILLATDRINAMLLSKRNEYGCWTGRLSMSGLSTATAVMAIEAYHKASLVHHDIQDDDQYRYGRETLHRQHGAGGAINIGDYLIGLGYRLIHAARDLSPEIATDVLNSISTAHIRLDSWPARGRPVHTESKEARSSETARSSWPYRFFASPDARVETASDVI